MKTSNIEHRTFYPHQLRCRRTNIEFSVFDIRRWIDNSLFLRKTSGFRRSGTPFTLIEVVLSIAILASALLISLSITAMGNRMMGKAVKRWEAQHILSQAAEYYLLEGPSAEIPEEFFPFDGYQAQCQVEPPELSGTDEIDAEYGSWQLVKLTITVTDSDGNEVGKIEMDKILKIQDVDGG